MDSYAWSPLHPCSCWTCLRLPLPQAQSLLAGNTTLLVHCVLLTLATDAPFFQMTLLLTALPSPIHWPWKGGKPQLVGHSTTPTPLRSTPLALASLASRTCLELPRWPWHVVEGLPLQTVGLLPPFLVCPSSSDSFPCLNMPMLFSKEKVLPVFAKANPDLSLLASYAINSYLVPEAE